jgi:hypothetical protein
MGPLPVDNKRTSGKNNVAAAVVGVYPFEYVVQRIGGLAAAGTDDLQIVRRDLVRLNGLLVDALLFVTEEPALAREYV